MKTNPDFPIISYLVFICVNLWLKYSCKNILPDYLAQIKKASILKPLAVAGSSASK
jgi:hypothetical protein